MTTDETPDPRRAALEQAAGGVLRQPDDAATFVDLDELDVDDDGNVDPRQARHLVEELATRKPYLAAPDAQPVPRAVDFDAGPRGAARERGPSVTDQIRRALNGRQHAPRDAETTAALWSRRLAPGRRPGAADDN